MSHGELDLSTLLRSLSPELRPGRWVFVCLPPGGEGKVEPLHPLATIREPQGLTAVLERSEALAAGLVGESVAAFAHLLLRVHSSLHAVGLTAAVAKALTEVGISANVIAGYHHDHVFVPEAKAAEALDTLRKLSKKAQ